ncbi:hypothetical protein Lal_00023081 [Lupinus albus]|nr:hypothetical protein Lal_00023081 [Lupinus albus]
MTIIRDIVSDLSDGDEIELCGDDNEEDVDVEIESKPNKYVDRCKHYGADCEWRIRASLNVKRDPGIPIKVLVKEIVSRFGYIVTYRKAWIAKQLTMTRIYDDWESSYNDLPRWMNVIQNIAPDTIFHYEVSLHYVLWYGIMAF